MYSRSGGMMVDCVPTINLPIRVCIDVANVSQETEYVGNTAHKKTSSSVGVEELETNSSS